MSCQLILKGSSPDILSESGRLKPLQISPKCCLLGDSKLGPLGFCVNFPPADQAVGPVLATGQGLPGSLAGHCSVSLESPFPCRVLSVSPTHTGKAFVQMLPCVCTPYTECLPLGGIHTDTPPPSSCTGVCWFLREGTLPQTIHGCHLPCCTHSVGSRALPVLTEQVGPCS